MALATRGEDISLTLGELRARAVLLKTSTGLDLRPTVKRIEQAGTCGPADRVLLARS